jgi:hypothetical protein
MSVLLCVADSGGVWTGALVSKYAPLREFLTSRADDVVTLTFAEIDALVGVLPPSARKYPVWWRNDDPSHQHCQSWAQAGYTAQPDLGSGQVTFRRTQGTGFTGARRPGPAPTVERPGAAADDASGEEGLARYAFISYVREDGPRIDELQQALETAGIPVWRDTARLSPGEDWRAKIRQAITDGSLVFVACFSRASLGRSRSYQNEELVLAIEELRRRRPQDSWLIPVRLDDCDIPELDIGGGRTLASIQRVDLFGARADEETTRLIAAVQRILSRNPAQPEVPLAAPGRGQSRAGGARSPRSSAPRKPGNWFQRLSTAIQAAIISGLFAVLATVVAGIFTLVRVGSLPSGPGPSSPPGSPSVPGSSQSPDTARSPSSPVASAGNVQYRRVPFSALCANETGDYLNDGCLDHHLTAELGGRVNSFAAESTIGLSGAPADPFVVEFGNTTCKSLTLRLGIDSQNSHPSNGLKITVSIVQSHLPPTSVTVTPNRLVELSARLSSGLWNIDAHSNIQNGSGWGLLIDGSAECSTPAGVPGAF